MSRIERPEDWEWTEDEHLAIWLAEILSTPPGESRIRELVVTFRDPVAWGKAVRALGHDGALRGRLRRGDDDMSAGYPRDLDGPQRGSWGLSQPYDGQAEMGEDW